MKRQKSLSFRAVDLRFRKPLVWPISALPLKFVREIQAPYRKRAHAVSDAIQIRQFIRDVHDGNIMHATNATVGVVVSICALIEGRLASLYEHRSNSVLGRKQTQQEEDFAYYLFVDGDDTKQAEHLKVLQIGQLLEVYGDISTVALHELEKYQKIRNPLLHQAIYRKGLIDASLIHALLDLYGILCRYRDVQKTQLQNEHKLETLRSGDVERYAGLFEENKVYSSAEIYRKLAGSSLSNVEAVFRGGKPVFVKFKRKVSDKLVVKSSIIVDPKACLQSCGEHVPTHCFQQTSVTDAFVCLGYRRVKLIQEVKNSLSIAIG